MRCPAQASDTMTKKAGFCLSLSFEPTRAEWRTGEGHGSQTLAQGLGVASVERGHWEPLSEEA